VVSLEPRALEEVFGTIELVGRLTDRITPATELVASLRVRVAKVRARITDGARRARVWVCEWLEPPYSARHWVSALVSPRAFALLFDAQFFGANVASLFPKVQPSAASLLTLVLMIGMSWVVGYAWACLYNRFAKIT
jgi:hypothetical protein